MSKITDIFAFATGNADYWAEFLSSSNYPSELTEEEVRGLNAARAHVEETTVKILHACAEQLALKLGPEKLPSPRPQPSATARNRSVNLPPPSGVDGKMYRIEFALKPDSEGREIQLIGSLVVKKASLNDFRQRLAELRVEHFCENYHVYSQGLPIKVDQDIRELAGLSVERVQHLLSGFAGV